jgi:hypothetical protein
MKKRSPPHFLADEHFETTSILPATYKLKRSPNSFTSTAESPFFCLLEPEVAFHNEIDLSGLFRYSETAIRETWIMVFFPAG